MDNWLENFLLLELGADYVVIMDNVDFHKSELTRTLIEQANCKLVFLLAYSPDLNPIEKFWVNLENKIKKIRSIMVTYRNKKTKKKPLRAF